MRPLEGRVAVVAGATRGAGGGIAIALGEATPASSMRENQPDVAAGWKTLDDTFHSYWGAMPCAMPGEPADPT